MSINAINNSKNGISVSLNAFSINFSGNMFDLISEAQNNTTTGIQNLEKEWSSKDFYPAIDPSATPGTGDTLQMELNSSAPTGQYVLITAVVDSNTLSLVSVNSTTFVVTPNEYTMDLQTGWNLVSTPLMPDPSNSTPSVFFAPINNNIEIVWAYNATNTTQPWEYYVPSMPTSSTLKSINEKSGYDVYMSNNASLNVYGTPIQGTDSISLYTGWNLIGYPSFTNSTPSPVFNSLNYLIAWGYDRYNQSNPWHYYYPTSQLGDLALTTGNGYDVYMNANGVLMINGLGD
jgi:hypothetical protein